MKKRLQVYWLAACFSILLSLTAGAQCSICTKTAQQLGEGPAKGLNTGIVYLAFTPFLIVGYIGYKWWQSNKE
ncbi:MAG: hypothetical protein E6Q24_09350 [Chitinophagaceae bacterium]|jgi:hypothetical protein|nr:hypothetical protein [Sphingobacteriales bacterium]OJW03111.1 MAG: hypothetical protein BGO52_02090 [Sphingobacteriales bacterium 44-61]TXJ27119.1 MAG: hypothetical protein E6Q24_09350 [Chitinophagaceae bacterium]